MTAKKIQRQTNLSVHKKDAKNSEVFQTNLSREDYLIIFLII